jgi:hypothetical protein
MHANDANKRKPPKGGFVLSETKNRTLCGGTGVRTLFLLINSDERLPRPQTDCRQLRASRAANPAIGLALDGAA